MGGKTSSKKWIRAESNFIALIATNQICQILAIFQWLNSKGLYLSLQIDRKNRCHVSPSSMKREMRKFFDVVVQWGPERNVKKSVMHMQSCANLLFFCRSRCLSFLLSTYERNISTDLVCVPMDLLPWAPVPLGFPAVLGLWEGGTGARGVEVYLGDLPDDEPVLEGLDWYWKKKERVLK